MCSVHSSTAAVNSGRAQLFDVIGYDSLGEPQATIGEGLALQGAISRSLGFNTQPGRLIAAVVPSGTVGTDKLGKPNTEPASKPENKPVDASSAADDSDAKEGAEDAGERNVANGSEITVRTIRWKCPDTGSWLWWHESLDAEKAAEVLDKLKRRDFHAELVTCQMAGTDVLQQQVYGAAATDDDGDDDKLYRILCIPYNGGAPYLAPHQFTYEQSLEWVEGWEGKASAWIVEDCQVAPAADSIAATIQAAVAGGDYTRLPQLGLGLGLLKHLQQVTSAIVDGKVVSVAHIGMVGRSLKRFAAQCCDGTGPDRHGDYDSDEFDRGMNGDVRDDELSEVLYRWLDVGLERDFPHLFEEATV